MCFSVTSSESLQNVKDKWLVELSHHAPNTPKLLVGTKIDKRADEETKQKVKHIKNLLVHIALVGGWMNISDTSF